MSVNWSALGQGVSVDAVQMALRGYEERIRYWWESEGLGDVSEIAFLRHGCRVVFSCMCFGRFDRVRSRTPVSDRSARVVWREGLQASGLVLSSENADGEDFEVVDCDASRAFLMGLVERTFGAVDFLSICSACAHTGESGGFLFWFQARDGPAPFFCSEEF